VIAMNIGINALFDIFITFFKIGSFTIGGGLAMIPLIERETVQNKGWIKEEEISDVISLCQSVPGVIAINISIFIGYRRAGLIGAFFAALGVILPSFLIIMLLSNILLKNYSNPYVQKIFAGAKVGVTALLAAVLIKLSRQIIKDAYAFIVAFCAFAAVIVFDVHPFIVIGFGIILGIIYYNVFIRGKVK